MSFLSSLCSIYKKYNISFIYNVLFLTGKWSLGSLAWWGFQIPRGQKSCSWLTADPWLQTPFDFILVRCTTHTNPEVCTMTLISRFLLPTELLCVFGEGCRGWRGNSTFSPALIARLSCCHYTVQMTASLCMHAPAKWIFTFGQIQGRRGGGSGGFTLL